MEATSTWLSRPFEVGAAEDIRTNTCDGWSSMLIACRVSHLDVAQWLFEAESAEDTRTSSYDGWGTMWMACRASHLEVA